ncbi:aldehyde dehydrogenase family protein [Candidatus Gottesmanbacteria bacterium]|nr:aldehyde dehydrogenase family protein [Candidatus Gottesmanbacteria bacterium]
MTKLISTDPAHNYKVVGSVSVSTIQEIKQKVALAQRAKSEWKEIGVAMRVGYIREIYNKLMGKKEDIIRLVVSETGKCLKDARSEVDRYGKNFLWSLENAETSLRDEVTYEDDKTIHKIIYEPFGVAAVITPWNHPFGMFAWGVIPNLLAGNTVVFKHSEECPLTGKFIEQVINSTSLPKGIFSEVYGNGAVGKFLIGQNINLIWFTGSSAVGKEIYKAGAEKFVKVVLEMGGSNPGIIFGDADIDTFIDKLYAKRFLTCGQTCDALKRLIVHESLFSEVVRKMKAKVEEKKVGDPEDEITDIGSLVAKRQADLLDLQVKDAIAKGAKVITGGSKPKNLQGAYYLPTILTKVKKNMRVWNEETFGPVLVIVPFKTEEEALALANDTKYGLGSLVFTADKERAKRVSMRLESGTVEINSAIHWLSCNPFGGYKESGIGREHGKLGFQELMQVKVVSMEK